MSMQTLRELCERTRVLLTQKDEIETELAEVQKELDILRLQKIPELMEALQLKTATFEGLGRVQLSADIYAATRAGQKEAAIQWLRDCGYDEMVSESYNAASLKALFRRQLEEGIEIPDDIFNVTPFVRASLVKG